MYIHVIKTKSGTMHGDNNMDSTTQKMIFESYLDLCNLYFRSANKIK